MDIMYEYECKIGKFKEDIKVIEKKILKFEISINKRNTSKWAANIRFVKYCKLNILKHELDPGDKHIYCCELGCADCPFGGTACRNTLPEKIAFMTAVVAKSEE